MKVSGCTFIRNGLIYDYPFMEAIASILPICDEVVVVVGKSDDTTKEEILKLKEKKIQIIDTIWDDNLRVGGLILSQQTNIALDQASGDWRFYIQGDEVMHEKYLPVVRESMEKYYEDERVEGLLFDYVHFYGSYDFIGDSRKWYRKEIRIVRNNRRIRSYKDAQGFRKDGKKLLVKQIPAEIYHYGWVRDPRAQQKKSETFNKYWHDDDWLEKNIQKMDEFEYQTLDSLKKFAGTHPRYMKERLKRKSWKFEYDMSRKNKSIAEKISDFIEKKTGYRIGEYKNYKLIE